MSHHILKQKLFLIQALRTTAGLLSVPVATLILFTCPPKIKQVNQRHVPNWETLLMITSYLLSINILSMTDCRQSRLEYRFLHVYTFMLVEQVYCVSTDKNLLHYQ